MVHKFNTHPVAIAVGLVVGASLFIGVAHWANQHAVLLQTLTHNTGGYSVLLYIAILSLSIIVAPIGTGFLLPIAAESYGPLLAALYSIVGWTLGAILAFIVVRYVKRTFFREAKILKQITAVEKTIPRWYFYTLVILFRMALPVDVVSYALALATGISFRSYVIATIVGITPTTILYSYSSQSTSFVQGAAVLFGATIFVSGLLLARYVLKTKGVISESS